MDMQPNNTTLMTIVSATDLTRERVRNYRGDVSLTQIAREINVSPGTMMAFRLGRTPQLDVLERIIRRFIPGFSVSAEPIPQPAVIITSANVQVPTLVLPERAA